MPRAIDGLESKSVRELQEVIEEAFLLLDSAADRKAGPTPILLLAKEARTPTLGAAAGSNLHYGSSVARRVVKTVLALVAAVAIGLVPLKDLLTAASTEAFVNAPIYTLQAPTDGRLLSETAIVGSRVHRDEEVGEIAAMNTTGDGNPVPLLAPTTGKIWEVLVQNGDHVRRGEDILRIVACTAASVTATVSEAVYDGLRPGMPARFNFFGDDRFYQGTVANLLGHTVADANLAMPAATLGADSFRAVVALPDLGSVPDCAVGRRGEVVFAPASD